MNTEPKTPRFVGTITLGNILTIFTLLIPVIGWGLQTKSSVEQNARTIEQNAKNIARHDVLLEKINETQQTSLRQLAVIEQKFSDHIEKTRGKEP